MARQKQNVCVVCKDSFSGRQNAKTCSARCRKRLQRAKNLLEREAARIKETVQHVENSAEEILNDLEGRLSAAGEEGFVEAPSSVATAKDQPLPLPTSTPPAANSASHLPTESFTPVAPLPAESLDLPDSSNSPNLDSQPVNVPSVVAAPLANAEAQASAAGESQAPDSVFFSRSVAPKETVTTATTSEETLDTPPLDNSPISNPGDQASIRPPKGPRFSSLRFPVGARFALVAVMVITLVAIGTYLLGNQSAQKGNKSSAADNISSNSSPDLLSDVSANSIHFNKATVIANGNSFTATGPSTFRNQTNSANAFNVQDASGNNLIHVDTVNDLVTITNLQGSGALLSSLNASQLSSGTISNSRLSSQVTLAGNSFNHAGELVQLDSTGNLPAAGASLLIDLNASQLTFGTVSNTRLNSDVAMTDKNQTFTAVNNFSNASNVFVGDGSGLTNLSASNISSGTLNNARLSSDVALTDRNGQTFTGSNIFQSASNSTSAFQIQNQAGNDNLLVADTINTRIGVGLANPSYTLDVNGDVNVSFGSSYRINGVPICSGAGCTPSSGSNSYIQIQASTPGTQQVGNGNISGTFIAGSFQGSGLGLTNLDASQLATGTVNDLRLSANVTLQGNNFNGASQLVQTTALSYLPALNGSLITNLNASALTSGTVNDSRLSNNVALLNAAQTFSGSNIFQNAITVPGIQTTNNSHNVSLGFTGLASANTSYLFNLATGSGTQTICTIESGNCAGSGSGVTASGTLAGYIPRFTPNGQTLGDSLIYDDASNIYIGETSDGAPQRLNVVGGIQSSTGLYVGGVQVCSVSGCGASSATAINNSTTRQTSANFFIQSSNSANVTGILEGASGQTADILDVQGFNGGTKYLAVTTSGISVGGNITTTGQYQVGGVQISSANLSNDSNLAKLNGTGPQTFSGNNAFTGTLLQKNTGTAVLQIQKADGTGTVFTADTTNTRIGIGVAPSYTLDVAGDVNISTGSAYRINGVAICGPSATCAPSSGSTSYIQNGITLQSNANLNIQSTATGSVTATLQGLSSQTADILDILDNTVSHNITLSVGANGAVTSKDFNGSGNASFFQIQSSSSTLFNANTTAGQISLPNATSSSTALLFGADAYIYRSASAALTTSGAFTTGGVLTVPGGSRLTSASGNLDLMAGNNGYIQLNTSVTKVLLTQATSLQGNTLYGGSSSGNNLTLESTSFSTKGTILVGTGASQAVTIGATTNTATLTLGQSTSGETIAIANGTVATGLTNTISIGTSATGTGKDVITIGNTNGASAVTLQGGSGGILLNAANTAIGTSSVAANGVLTVGTNTTAASGGIYFGTDTNLYRLGANSLKTDSNLYAAGEIRGTGIRPNTSGSGGLWTSGGQLTLNQNGGSATTLQVKDFSGQTGDLAQFQDSNGAVFTKLDSKGQLTSYGTNTQYLGLATPSISSTSTATTGGTLAQNTTYFYQMTATNSQGETVGSATSSQLTGNTTATNTITLNWSQINGATGYKIYRNTSNSFGSGSLLLTTISNGSTITYTDTGTATSAGLPPTAPTGTGLTLQGWSGQTASLLALQNSAGSSVFSSDVSGNLIGAGNLTFSGASPIISASTTNTGLTLQANGSGQLNLNTATTGAVSIGNSAGVTVGGNLGLGANSLTLTGSIASSGSRVTKGWFTDLDVTNTITGSISGNAATVTGFSPTAGKTLTLQNSMTFSAGNDLGVYTFPTGTATLLATNGSIASLTGTISSTVLGNSSLFVGTTSIALNRASAAMALTGISGIDNNAVSQSITIGNSTGGTITIGATSGSDLVLQDAQWGVTGAGAADFASLDGTPIGATTASTGKFTTLNTTSTATLASLTVSGATTTFSNAAPVITTSGLNSITLQTPASSSTTNLTTTGGITLQTGSETGNPGSGTNGVFSGNITIQTGNATLGATSSAGVVTIDTGASSSGNNSSVLIGTSANGAGVQIGNSAGAVLIYFEPTIANHGVCKSFSGAGLYEITACSATPGADYAELYPTETSVHQGDLVMPNGNYVTSKDGKYQEPVLKQTQTSYDSGEIGVISEQTLAENGDEGALAGNNINSSDNPQALALNGRVMTKVDTEGGDIAPGDYITASSTPGVGMKATHAGEVVGRALASYSGSGVSQILVFINPSYYNPDNNIQGDSGTFDLVTANGITVNTLTVNGTATFNGDIVVNGHVVGNSDTNGTVRVNAGSDIASYAFNSVYTSAPNVVVTPESNPGSYFWVTKTPTGFTIHMASPATSNVVFDYVVQGRN